MKAATTVQLRLRGMTPLALLVTAASTLPSLVLGWQILARGGLAPGQEQLLLIAVGGAAMPWLSRAWARSAYRAKVDEVALHLRGEALPWKTIKQVTVERSGRRTTLKLRRSETIELELVLDDAFIGHLEPREALAARLREHGHDLQALLRQQ